MSPEVYSAFVTELLKLSALNTNETDMLREAVRQQAKFDQMAAQGKLDAEGQAAMRANVERIKAFRAKSKGEASTIPGWAKKPEGAPPPPKSRAYASSGKGPFNSDFYNSRGAPMHNPFGGLAQRAMLGAQLGGLTGAALGILGSNSETKKQKQKREEKMQPIANFHAEHPGLSGAAHGALAGATAWAFPRIGMIPFAAGTIGAGVLENELDKAIGKYRVKKRQQAMSGEGEAV